MTNGTDSFLLLAIIEEHASVGISLFRLWKEEDEKKKQQDEKLEIIRYTMLVETLPGELWIHIFGFMDPLDIVRCRGVCRKWCSLASDEYLWRGICMEVLELHDVQKESEVDAFWFFCYFRHQHMVLRERTHLLGVEETRICVAARLDAAKNTQLNYWIRNPNEPRVCGNCGVQYLEVLNSVGSCRARGVRKPIKHIFDAKSGKLYAKLRDSTVLLNSDSQLN